MNKTPVYNGPARFAHRGLVQAAPENTIEAFKAAIEFSCEGIELDVRASKDGVPIVVHDENMSRMTDGKITGCIRDLDSSVILSADIPYAGHLLPFESPVPYSEQEGSVRTYSAEELEHFRNTDKRMTHLSSFEEFDNWFSTVKADVTIEIEICDDGVFPLLYPILCQSENLDRYIVFSGREIANEEIQGICRKEGKPGGLRLGANIRWLNEKTREFVENSDLYEVGLNDFRFSEEDARWLKDRGIKLFSNLGDYPEWWSAIKDLEMTAFKTNYAQQYTQWYFNRGEH